MQGQRAFTFLGTGTSVGVPMVGCDCPVCQSGDPHNHRYRCSVLVQLPEGNVLIDTSPELRLQLLREKVNRIDAVIYTHYHVDHLFGLDDLRPYCKYQEGPIPVYCNEETEDVLKRVFSYAFPEKPPKEETYVPQLDLRRIELDPFTVLGHEVIPIALKHARFHVLGFRFDNIAYCTDVNQIPEESMEKLRGLDVLVLDALRHKPHPTHLSISEALSICEQLQPKQAYFTHMSHDVDHETVNRELPSNVNLAYDGLTFHF